MGAEVKISKSGKSGRYIFKNWQRDNEGRRVGAYPASSYGRSADLIASCYLNNDGLLTNFCIPIDLDADRAESKWKKADGSLDWGLIQERMQECLPEVAKYLAYATVSTGGKGLSLVFGIKPMPIRESTYSNQGMYLLTQSYLVKALGRCGFGADSAAVGLTRDFPNFMNSSRNLFSNPGLFRLLESSRDEQHFNVISDNCVRFCRSEERKERLYSDARVEQGLAQLFIHLLEEAGNFTLSSLVEITGLSGNFLRKFLKKNISWLKIFANGHGDGWRIELNQSDPLYAIKVKRAYGLIDGDYFHASLEEVDPYGLSLPEGVEDGFRNQWLHQLALLYKWNGYVESEALNKIRLRMVRIPGSSSSRNCKNVAEIVRSIYGNHRQNFGKKSHLPLPVWMSDDSGYGNNFSGCGHASEVFLGPKVELIGLLSPEVGVVEEVVSEPPISLVVDSPCVSRLVRESLFATEGSWKPSEEVSLVDSELLPSGGSLRSPAVVVALEVPPGAPEALSLNDQGAVGSDPVCESVLAEVVSLADAKVGVSEDTSLGSPTVVVSLVSSAQPLAPLFLKGQGSLKPLSLKGVGGFHPARNQIYLSLKKGEEPLSCGVSLLSRKVSFDGHVGFLGARYSVGQEFTGVHVGVSELEGKVSIFYRGYCVENHEKALKGRVTKLDHKYYPQKKKVRVDGHISFHGKLYSTGDGHIHSRLRVFLRDGMVRVTDSLGHVIAEHVSIQETAEVASTHLDDCGPWEKAMKPESYYRERAKSFCPEADTIVLHLLLRNRGVIPAAKINYFFSLLNGCPRSLRSDLLQIQFKKKDYSLRSFVRNLNSYKDTGWFF